MDILKLMREKEQEFSALQSKTREINTELLMLQGEYRLLRELGIEQGVLNESGDPIDKQNIEV